MRKDLAKRIFQAGIFTLVLLIGSVALPGSTAQAQGRHWGGNFRGGFVYRSPRVFVAPRFYAFPRVYSYPRYYQPYGAPYGAYGFGYTPRYDAGPSNVAQDRGYHDGYDRGAEDARDGRRYDPNNSSHFRDSISSAYRDGFRRGYDNGYRQRAG